jgi:hypothetical protein
VARRSLTAMGPVAPPPQRRSLGAADAQPTIGGGGEGSAGDAAAPAAKPGSIAAPGLDVLASAGIALLVIWAIRRPHPRKIG